MSFDANITKGLRISATWFKPQIDPPASLAGMQMKFSGEMKSVTGKITHVYGDRPVNPTKIEIVVQPDDGGAEVTVKPEWIREIEKDGKMIAVKLDAP